LRIALAHSPLAPAQRGAAPAGANRPRYFFFAGFDLPLSGNAAGSVRRLFFARRRTLLPSGFVAADADACFGFDALPFALGGVFDFFAFGAADFTGAAVAAAVGGAGDRA
jgi:hypothetical protein